MKVACSPRPFARPTRTLVLWAGVVLLQLFPVRAQTPGEADVVFRIGQKPQSGRIVGIDAGFLRFQMQVLPGRPPAVVAIPRSAIERIEFGERPSEQALIDAGDDLPGLELLWRSSQPFLGIPRSPAGAAGSALADALLRTGDPAQAARALDLFTRIEASDWDADRKAAARRGRLRAMVAAGRAAEAVAEAKELAEESEDPAVLIEASYVLAKAEADELRELVKENPRWEEDERVRPERDKLYHRALDRLLYPFLFHGTETDACARGLWEAVSLQRFSGEETAAARTAGDIVFYYPDAVEAGLATEYLKTTKHHDDKNK